MFFLNINFSILTVLTQFSTSKSPAHFCFCWVTMLLPTSSSEIRISQYAGPAVIVRSRVNRTKFGTPTESTGSSAQQHITRLMYDTKTQTVSISAFDHWQPVISFQWEVNLETLLCPTKWNSANAGHPSSCQAYFSVIYRNTPSPWSSSARRRSISGSATILRMKISPRSQRFGHGQCQESHLFWPYFGTYLQASMQS